MAKLMGSSQLHLVVKYPDFKKNLVAMAKLLSNLPSNRILICGWASSLSQHQGYKLLRLKSVVTVSRRVDKCLLPSRSSRRGGRELAVIVVLRPAG